MRKRTREYIREIIREEMMIQTAEVVKSELYTLLKNTFHIDVTKVNITDDIHATSFELYLGHDNINIEVAHYHIEDCMWVATHLNEVRQYLHKHIRRFIKSCNDGITIDERN